MLKFNTIIEERPMIQVLPFFISSYLKDEEPLAQLGYLNFQFFKFDCYIDEGSINFSKSLGFPFKKISIL